MHLLRTLGCVAAAFLAVATAGPAVGAMGTWCEILVAVRGNAMRRALEYLARQGHSWDELEQACLTQYTEELQKNTNPAPAPAPYARPPSPDPFEEPRGRIEACYTPDIISWYGSEEAVGREIEKLLNRGGTLREVEAACRIFEAQLSNPGSVRLLEPYYPRTSPRGSRSGDVLKEFENRRICQRGCNPYIEGGQECMDSCR